MPGKSFAASPRLPSALLAPKSFVNESLTVVLNFGEFGVAPHSAYDGFVLFVEPLRRTLS